MENWPRNAHRFGEDRRRFDALAPMLSLNLPLFAMAGRGDAWPAAGEARQTLAVRLRDRAVVTGAVLGADHQPPRFGPFGFIFLTLGLIAAISAAFLWWAARGLTAPLTRFRSAAEDFSANRDLPPLPENHGPDEVRTAFRALNHMQTRVRKLIEDRTRMLAAVSHDLRTPITRMRLRAELMEQSDARCKMLRDLDQMDGMVHAALAYLREGQSSSPPGLVDVASLLQLICNDFSDLGADVTYEGPSHLLGRVHDDELQRAVSNLVDNALKHGGGRATMRLLAISDAEIAVDVVDAGPGIPVGLKDAVLAPFVRGDAARANHDGPSGFGLGLAIARSSAELHGGKLQLFDAQPSGLTARLTLPLRNKLA
jgi:signal transduction histidine kinase